MKRSRDSDCFSIEFIMSNQDDGRFPIKEHQFVFLAALPVKRLQYYYTTNQQYVAENGSISSMSFGWCDGGSQRPKSASTVTNTNVDCAVLNESDSYVFIDLLWYRQCCVIVSESNFSSMLVNLMFVNESNHSEQVE